MCSEKPYAVPDSFVESSTRSASGDTAAAEAVPAPSVPASERESTVEERLAAPGGWKRRIEDPLNTYYRYPIAKVIARALMSTPVTPNQVTMVQPFIAGVAAYLVTFNDWRYHVAAALTFEFRSILDCVDGTLARAKKMSSPSGHAIDGLADWLSVVALYVGIFWHFHLHPPAAGSWSAYLSVNGLLAIALFQGAVRSFAADYYKTKYLSIFSKGVDESKEALRAKLLALQPGASIFAHAEIFIMRMGHLSFEHEWFGMERARKVSDRAQDEEQVRLMAAEQSAPRTKFIGFLWSVSSGDAFLSFVILTLLLGQLWAGQLFFATFGIVWIFAVIAYNRHFVRSFERRSKLAEAKA